MRKNNFQHRRSDIIALLWEHFLRFCFFWWHSKIMYEVDTIFFFDWVLENQTPYGNIGIVYRCLMQTFVSIENKNLEISMIKFDTKKTIYCRLKSIKKKMKRINWVHHNYYSPAVLYFILRREKALKHKRILKKKKKRMS
jgi:hypothetical protein